MKRAESVASERAVLVGVLLADQDHPSEPLEELEGLAEAAGAQVVGQLTQRRPAPDAATYLGKGKVEELQTPCRLPRRRRDRLRQRPRRGASPQPGEDPRAEGRRPHRADPRHLCHPGADLRGPAGRGAGPVGIRDAAAEADVDAPLPAGPGRHRAAGSRREAVGSRPAAGRAADRRPQGRARGHPPPQGAGSGRPAGLDDRLPRRLHQRGQEYADERPDRGQRLCRGPVVRHARHADPALAVARLGPGAVERHGGLHPRLAASPHRQLQGHAGRGPAGRPVVARGRRRQPGRLRPDQRRLPRAGGDSASRPRTRFWS